MTAEWLEAGMRVKMGYSWLSLWVSVLTYRQILIIIAKTAPFRATAFLRRFCLTESGFHFFGFCNNIFFYRARSSDLRPATSLEYPVLVLMSPSERMAQLYSQAPASLLRLGGLQWRHSNPPQHEDVQMAGRIAGQLRRLVSQSV
jgi:hypothetical protein